jgi:hypothetical protein
MSQVTLYTGASATEIAIQELPRVVDRAPPGLLERLLPPVKQIVELASRFFAGRPDAAVHISV